MQLVGVFLFFTIPFVMAACVAALVGMILYGAFRCLRRVALFAIALLALTGCASLRDFNDGTETAFQAAHIVDVAQSFHGAASDRCYLEGDPVTRGLIGAQPSHAGVIAWGVAYALVHYGVHSWLEEQGYEKLDAIWQIGTLADTAYAVGKNYSIGIRIGAPNTDYPACPQWARP